MTVLLRGTICLTLLSCLHMLRADTVFISTKEDVSETLSNIFTVGDELAFLTDFDGTLAEINPNPVLSRMNAKTTELIHRLARHPNIHLAVISGRRLSDVRERVGIANITYSGNHGMEITFSNQMEYHYPMPPEVYLNCSLLRNVLQQKLATHGAWVEDKNVSLTYHYRSVPAELQDEYVTLARQHTRDFGYKSVQAHYAIEIKPPVIWSKGDAAKVILAEMFGDAWMTKDIKIIFAGDDNSDEDVMRVLKGKATLFRISGAPEIETSADFVLESVKTMTDVLEWIDSNL